MRCVLPDRALVLVAALCGLLGSLWGMGLGHGGSQRQGAGLFSDCATLVTPAAPAFLVWTPIYLGLAGYTAWQWFATSSRWAARTRRLAALVLVLDGLWLAVVRAGWTVTSVVVMAGLVLALGRTVARVGTDPREGPAADVLVGATFGLHLGWITIGLCADVAVALVSRGMEAGGRLAEMFTVMLLGMIVSLACVVLLRVRVGIARWATAGGMAWGLAWIGIGRLAGALHSTVAGVAALVASVLVLAAAQGAARRGLTDDAPPVPVQELVDR